MAQSPSDSQVDGEVLEGLLCPICLLDLKTIGQLQDHVETAHPSDDNDVFQSLKGLFGKAKRKILKQDIFYDEPNRFYESRGISPLPQNAIDFPSQPQETGASVSHTESFKKLRESKIDRYVVETNKLLIRLDKLITDAPDDPEKRKDHEKCIVPWVSDADVRLCPGCAKSFGLSRRRHHCRLCGGIMCHACSHFIDFSFARKLTHPTVCDDGLSSPLSKPLQRRGSNSSLLSVVNITGEPHIRVCRDCRALLLRRDQQVEQRLLKPVVVEKYERMKEYMTEVEKLAPTYIKMIDSLISGEKAYHLEDAQLLKVKLTRLSEGIDTISKTIAKLECTDSTTSFRSLQLQSGIRMAASQFLKNTVLGLPALPTPEEIIRFQNLREEELQRKIVLERQAEMRLGVKNGSEKNSPRHHVTNVRQEPEKPVSVEAGWSVSPGKLEHEDDPMLQQINIIHKYIQQARLDHKYDEVHMLENNLRDLKEEYRRQQQQRHNST